MKYLITLGLLFSFIFGYSQTEVEISSPISVTNNSSEFGRNLPKIEMLNDGRIIVFWSKYASSSKLYLAIQDGDSFADPILIPTGTVNPNVWGYGLGPEFAIMDSVIFVTFEKYGVAIYCVKSTDLGQSFSDPVIVYDPPAGRRATLPTISISNEYNPVVGFITTNANELNAEYVVVSSIDGGETFGEAVIASVAADGDYICECCPSSITFNNEGDYFVSFRNNDDNVRDIWVSKSMNNGITFPVATDVDETDWVIQGCPTTGPHSFDMGNDLVNVFFSSATGWDHGVYVSTLNKETMISGETNKLPTIDGMDNLQNFPRIDGNMDTLGVVWNESVSGNTEIILAYSTTGVADLLVNKVNVSDVIGKQSYPDIEFKNGKYHIVYEDQISGTVMYQVATILEPVIVNNSNALSNELKVYPNPGNNEITIEVIDNQTNNSKLIISDVTGRVFYTNDHFKNKTRIEIGKWKSGVYLVTVQSNNKRLHKKLIIP